jgi:hypothetical protein
LFCESEALRFAVHPNDRVLHECRLPNASDVPNRDLHVSHRTERLQWRVRRGVL